MKITPPTDPAHCPLCGKPNQCAMELERSSGQKQPPCWCTQADFSADLLAQIPAESKGKACVCAACAHAATPC
ncbi:cysteine-rich CWC family protein [Rhodoferax sp. PAMC 29310]|uniref:cysteine-rich CWC family protein n=1 Tax=Rhodoferax sp. PAMC 29310 TaxID=2822760 RepID=UPI001B342D3A|nr:cysteine-rich CWC family protein [Rhodoferax sp. PAMC 29310]